jgi:hypothetical protein
MPSHQGGAASRAQLHNAIARDVTLTPLRAPNLSRWTVLGLEEEFYDNHSEQNSQDVRDTVLGKDIYGIPTQGKQSPKNH